MMIDYKTDDEIILTTAAGDLTSRRRPARGGSGDKDGASGPTLS